MPCHNRDTSTGQFTKTATTPDQDLIIRNCWATEKWNLTAAKKAAQLTGLKYSRCERRAIELGIHSLNQTRHVPWTDEELDTLEAGVNNLRSLLSIQKSLLDKGFRRGLSGIREQITVHKILSGRTGMNKKDLAAAFGISPNTLEKWRLEGKIHAQRLPDLEPNRLRTKGPRKGQRGRAHEDMVPWNYSRPAIRKFLYLYPNLIKLGWVDQVWFMDLINTTEFTRPTTPDQIKADLRPVPLRPLYEPREEHSPSSVQAAKKKKSREATTYPQLL